METSPRVKPITRNVAISRLCSIAVKFADRPRQHADLAGVIGLTYDSLALPSGGTITGFTYLANGVTTTWSVSGIWVSVPTITPALTTPVTVPCSGNGTDSLA